MSLEEIVAAAIMIGNSKKRKMEKIKQKDHLGAYKTLLSKLLTYLSFQITQTVF